MKRGGVIFLWMLLSTVLLQVGEALPDEKVGQNSSAVADQASTAVPSITFERLWNDFKPQSVTMTVSANGAAKYSSRNPEKTGDDVDDFQTEFTMKRTILMATLPLKGTSSPAPGKRPSVTPTQRGISAPHTTIQKTRRSRRSRTFWPVFPTPLSMGASWYICTALINWGWKTN
jgi:hypothetical protein